MELQELIELCADRWKTEGSSALEGVCTEYPAQADDLRKRWATLRELGSLRSEYGIECESPIPEVRTVARVELPSTVGRFRLEEELGRGGSGVVYRAIDGDLERTVALKLLFADVANDTEVRSRLREEARAIAALKHPHIGAIHSIESHGDDPYLVLEYIPGENLHDRYDRGTVDAPRVLAIGAEIASALAAAHDAGIVHRDLKPSNVVVTPEGSSRVLDFGLAHRVLEPGLEGRKGGGPRGGTVRYMGPQQWQELEPGPADDIWSLGCLLFEGLSGGHAFLGEDRDEIRARVLAGEIDPRRLPESTAPEVRQLLSRCFSLERSERPSAEECREVLSAAAAGHSLTPRFRLRTYRRLVPRGQRVPFHLSIENRSADPLRGTVEVGSEAIGWSVLRDVNVPAGESLADVLLLDPSTLGVGELGGGEPARARLRLAAASAGHGAPLIFDRLPVIRAGAALPEPIPESPQREQIIEQVLRAHSEVAESRSARRLQWVGPRGSGRSTLLSRAAGAVEKLGSRVLYGRAASAPHAPRRVLIDLLHDSLGTDPTGGDLERSRRRIASALRDLLGDQPHTVTALTRWSLGEVPEAMSPELRKLHWLRWFEAFSREEPPLFIAIDDLDHADEETREIVEAWWALARDGDVAVTMVFTESTSAAPPADSSSAAGTETIALAPITTEGVSAWIRSRYPGVGHLDTLPWLPAALVSETGGNVARLHTLIEELSTKGSEACLLVEEGARWRLAREGSEEAFRAAISGDDDHGREARTLPDGARSVLESAALLGEVFSVSVIELDAKRGDSAIELSRAEVDRTLDVLESGGFIEVEDPTLEWYRFRRRLQRAAVLEEMADRGSRALARRASALSRSAIEIWGDHPEHGGWLGDLLSRGGKPGEALDRWIANLELLLERGDSARALPLFERTDALLASGFDCGEHERFALERARARVALKLGRWEEARAAIDRALASAEVLPDSADSAVSSEIEFPAELWILRAEAEIRNRDLDSAESSLARASEIALRGKSREAQLSAENLRGIVCKLRGQADAARAIYAGLLAEARRGGERLIEAKALNNLGAIEWDAGGLEPAADAFLRAATIFERFGNLDHATAARVWLANIALRRARLEEAEEGYAHALEIQRLLQNRPAIAATRGNLALVELLAGRFDRAIGEAREARMSSQLVNDSDRAAKAGILLAEALAQCGRPDEALEVLESVVREAGGTGASTWVEHASAIARLVRLRNGASEEDFRPTRPLSAVSAVCALQLLTEEELSHRGGPPLPKSWHAEVEALVRQLDDPTSAELRLQLEVALARAAGPTQAAIERLLAAIDAAWVLPGCDRHAARSVLDALTRQHGSLTEEDLAVTRAALEEQASRITDPDLRRRYLESRTP